MLVKFIELFVGHCAYRSVSVFIEAIKSDMFPRKKTRLHEALNNDAEAAVWYRLNYDSNCGWT